MIGGYDGRTGRRRGHRQRWCRRLRRAGRSPGPHRAPGPSRIPPDIGASRFRAGKRADGSLESAGRRTLAPNSSVTSEGDDWKRVLVVSVEPRPNRQHPDAVRLTVDLLIDTVERRFVAIVRFVDLDPNPDPLVSVDQGRHIESVGYVLRGIVVKPGPVRRGSRSRQHRSHHARDQQRRKPADQGPCG